MSNVNFDLEQQIMTCWNITSDIHTLYEAIGDRKDKLSEDEILNILLGLEHMYQLKFEKLFELFEKSLAKN